MHLELYRKSPAKLPKLTKAQMEALEKDLSHKFAKRKVRVLRPNITRFLLNGEYNKLPVVEQTQIYNPYVREQDGKKYWTVPVEDMGYKKEPSESTANSIKIWVTQNLAEYGVTGDMFTILAVEDD